MEDTTGAGITGTDGDFMVTVRITELYDLNTVRNKMGLIAVHTPGYSLIRRLYPGFLMNYDKMKAVKCDIAVACASMLPADPLQVGTSTGDIAPEDLFNPILYRACTNDSFNTIINRAYYMDPIQTGSSVDTPGTVGNDPWTGGTGTSNPLPNSSDIYYALLADDGWKKAMPQTGFSMHGLVPLVYPLLNTFGNVNSSPISGTNNTQATVLAVNQDGTTMGWKTATTFRGRPLPMPGVPTTVGTNQVDVHELDYDVPVKDQPGIPKTFVAVIVTAPSKLHVLYYRLRVTWTIEFYDVITMNDKATRGSLLNNGAYFHVDGIAGDSKYLPADDSNLGAKSDFVDTSDADIKKIMES